MKLNDKEDVKRLGIFFFYDNDGVVDDYVMHMLDDMVLNTTQNIVVCNGKLTEEGRKRFETLPNVDILIRENKGFDVWAYKSALEYYGWDVIDTYDGIFMYNFTIMGPIGHFSTMFDEMNQRDLDFWGITIHNGAPFDPWGNMKEGKIPIHIQSHFIAVRNEMIRSEKFHKYWDERPMITCYEDAVGLHEAVFTEIFQKAGYRWDVYVNTEDLVEQTFYPLFNMPVDLIKNRKCPIFKRKLFINDFEGTIQENANLSARELFDYLEKETHYDTDMIIGHLLRSANLSSIISGMNLNYILDDVLVEKKDVRKNKCGVFVSAIGWDNHFYEYCEFLKNVPKDVDVHLAVEEKNRSFKADRVHVYCIKEKIEQFELLMYFEEKIRAYDVVCLIDSYKMDAFPMHNVLSARDFLYREMLESEGYIERIISLFDDNKRLGMLVPNAPVHGEYHFWLDKDWKKNYMHIKEKVEAYNLRVDVRKEKISPVAIGNCCWIRTEILEEKVITEDKKNWQYLLPLIAQSKGKYTARVCPAKIGENLLNSFYEYRENSECYRIAAEVYYDLGQGFKVEEVEKVTYAVNMLKKEEVEVKISIPCGTKYIRFDPCEGFMCVCSDIKCDIEAVKIHNVNGIRFGVEDLFLTKDPQYVLEGDFTVLKEITLTMKNISIFWSENGLEKEMKGIFKEREELVKAVQHLRTTYGELEQEKNRKDKELLQTKEWLENVRIEGLQQRDEIEELRNELAIIKESKAWKVISMYRDMKNKVLKKNK